MYSVQKTLIADPRVNSTALRPPDEFGWCVGWARCYSLVEYSILRSLACGSMLGPGRRTDTPTLRTPSSTSSIASHA
jgi:hypothetical protein